MNIIHTRDRVKWMLGHKMISDKEATALFNAPVFVHRRESGLTADELDWVRDNGCEPAIESDSEPRVPRLPFPAMIIHEYWPDDEKQNGGKDLEADIYLMRKDPSKAEYYYMMIGTSMHGDTLRCDFNNRNKRGVWIAGWFPDGSSCESLVTEGSCNFNNAIEAAGILRRTVLAMCFDVFSKCCVTVKVSPPPNGGKSVQWVRSREHYLVLPPKVAAACAMGKRGPTQHEITRAAHWRRAHIRTLMSAKFTHKRGQKVPVRHAWVGPVEWMGDDKKVYSLVHLDGKGGVTPMKGGGQ